MAVPVATGTVVQVAGTYNSPRSQSVTVPADAEIIVVAFMMGYEAHVPTGITWDGAAMTKLDDQDYTSGNNGGSVAVYYLKTGDAGFKTGTFNVQVTFTDGGGSNAAILVRCYKQINTTSPWGTPSKGSGTADPASRTITDATANDLVLDWIAKQMSAAGETVTVGAGQTVEATADSGNGFLHCQARHSREAGAASVTMSWTLSSTTKGYSHIACTLKGSVATAAGPLAGDGNLVGDGGLVGLGSLVG